MPGARGRTIALPQRSGVHPGVALSQAALTEIGPSRDRPAAAIAPKAMPPGGMAVAADASAHFCTCLAPNPFEIRRTLLQIRKQFVPLSDDDTVGRLELVLAEILNNIAEHGDPLAQNDRRAPHRKVHLSAATATGGIYCIVSDVGEEVPSHCLAPRPLPQQGGGAAVDLPEGGFGWFIIQLMARKLFYCRDGRRNILAFLIPQDSPIAAA